jgi:hypothetical protein
MSPDALSLTIQAIDKNGHLAVVIGLESHNYILPEPREVLQTGFEIDPTSIPDIITGLKKKGLKIGTDTNFTRSAAHSKT